MSVVASDLVIYQAATQSSSDSGTVGGAIDTLRRPDFTQMAANDTVQVISSAAGDTTQTVTATARDTQGRVVTQTVTLNGTSAVNFNTLGTVTRILQIEMSATATGTVTVRRTTGPTTIRTIPAGERGFSAMMRLGASSTSVEVDYYAKTFWKNTNGANALLSAQVSLSANPTNLISFGLAASVDDAGTATTRQTAPAGVVFATTTANCPGTDLAFGSAIGTWFKMALPAAQAAVNSTVTPQISGATT